MNALVDNRSSTLLLHKRPQVLLGGNGRMMQGTFDIVTQNLLNLGACPIEKLADSPKTDLEGFELPYVPPHLDLPPGSMQPPPRETPPVLAPSVVDDKEKEPFSMEHVAQLHQTCQQTFGNSEPLKFEFIEEEGPDHKQCILTIRRPNGLTRSYASEPNFRRKSDAKARVATIAVEMGAVDFILYGNKDSLKASSKLVLAPIDARGVKQEFDAEEESPTVEFSSDEFSKQIEECCVEWRAGQVRPRWVFFTEHKINDIFGCVVVIELSPHLQRTYSVRPSYDSKFAAKKGVSELAINQGAIDFIKFGNGQSAPTPAPVRPIEHVIIKDEPDIDKKGRTVGVSLQSFFDSLPKPFPESTPDRPISEVNAPGMLNTTLQLAKGAKLSLQFWFTSESTLHGSILRLESPSEVKTYMVDPKFGKRADAKSAVCLLAMSQGIGQYIRNAASAVENKITPEMRKRANEQILPILGSEYARLRQGMHPSYEYDNEQGAFGCTLVLTLSSDPKEDEIKKWKVPTEFRTKADAKIAVVCRAGQEAIEFVRFRGQPVPSDHDPFKPYRRPKEGSQTPESSKQGQASRGKGTGERNTSVKKEESPPSLTDLMGLRPPVKRRTATTSGQVKLGLPLLETKDEALARQKAEIVNWTKHDPPKSRSRPLNRSPPVYSESGSARPGPLSTSTGPYDVAAAATAVIHRLTNGPMTAPPSSSPGTTLLRSSQVPVPSRSSQHPPPPPTHSIYHTAPFQMGVQRGAHPYLPYPPSQYPHVSSTYQHPASSHMTSTPAYGISNPPPPLSSYYPNTHPPQYVAPASFPQPPPFPSHPYGYSQLPSQPAHYVSIGAREDGAPPVVSAQRDRRSRGSKDTTPTTRSASFNAGAKDRQKRPRSRERTPPNSHLPKKQRSESSLPLPESAKSNDDLSERGVIATTTAAIKPNESGRRVSVVALLLEYCSDEGIPYPEFLHKPVKNEAGEEVFKVWIVMGKERLELPTLFTTVNEGKQRLAKQVLRRLRTRNQST